MGTAERLTRPFREVNNIATVTQGFWRLSVNTCRSFTVLHTLATTRLGSVTQTLISLSVHYVRWGWLRTQNEGCLNCCAVQCGHNPLTKRGNLSLHASLDMPERLPSWFSMTGLSISPLVYVACCTKNRDALFQTICNFLTRGFQFIHQLHLTTSTKD